MVAMVSSSQHDTAEAARERERSEFRPYLFGAIHLTGMCTVYLYNTALLNPVERSVHLHGSSGCEIFFDN